MNKIHKWTVTSRAAPGIDVYKRQAQDSTSSKISGTGLGMAITKNIVDLMDGDIMVDSEPEKGSVFTVTLPLKLQDAPKEEVPEEWLGVHSLIVDDDLQTCERCV